jgi:hypothetical protein
MLPSRHFGRLDTDFRVSSFGDCSGMEAVRHKLLCLHRRIIICSSRQGSCDALPLVTDSRPKLQSSSMRCAMGQVLI